MYLHDAMDIRIKIPADYNDMPMIYYFGNVGSLHLDSNSAHGAIHISAGSIDKIHNWASAGSAPITISAHVVGTVLNYYRCGTEAVHIAAESIGEVYTASR
jgi:hypothetical protein